MCVVSMIGDHYRDKLQPYGPYTVPVVPPLNPYLPLQQSFDSITRWEFNQLKAQVEEMIELMKRAKKYDEEHGEPNCEMDEKLVFLKAIAKLVGIDLVQAVGLSPATDLT